jgi:hypothetical protein
MDTEIFENLITCDAYKFHEMVKLSECWREFQIVVGKIVFPITKLEYNVEYHTRIFYHETAKVMKRTFICPIRCRIINFDYRENHCNKLILFDEDLFGKYKGLFLAV